ncbi:endonuclease domain-containing protein [Hyphomicrobium denitrificans]|nr:endonuclease domain-containing protein [Hyphomicrobium denitrificans]
MANEVARSLRKNRTGAERELWSRFRELKQAGFKFRQQAPIDRFIVDFVCFAKRLIVEVDGATHGTESETLQDSDRQQYLVQQGFRVVRFLNDDVFRNVDGVMDTIIQELKTPTPSPSPQGGGV